MSPALDGGGHGGGHGVQEENRAECHRQRRGPLMPAHRLAEALGHGAMVSRALFGGGCLWWGWFLLSEAPFLSSPPQGSRHPAWST